MKTDQFPTVPEARLLQGKAMVVVRFAVPPVSTPIFPEGNAFATILLCELLGDRLQLSGVSVIKRGSSFPLNSAFLCYTLESKGQIVPALETISRELSALNLLEMAVIAWHDPAEDILRTLNPKGGTIEFPSDAEFKAERERCDLVLLKARAATKKQLFEDLLRLANPGGNPA